LLLASPLNSFRSDYSIRSEPLSSNQQSTHQDRKQPSKDPPSTFPSTDLRSSRFHSSLKLLELSQSGPPFLGKEIYCSCQPKQARTEVKGIWKVRLFLSLSFPENSPNTASGFGRIFQSPSSLPLAFFLLPTLPVLHVSLPQTVASFTQYPFTFLASMATSPPSDPSIAHLSHALNACRISLGCWMGLFLWDYIASFPQETKYVWKSKWTPLKTFWLLK